MRPALRATLLMTASAVMFGVMAVVIRLASEHMHAFEIGFFRSFFGLIFALPLLIKPGLRLLHTQRFSLYLLRSLFGTVSMLCSFWALSHLPLAQAISISYSTPLFVTIGAVLMLGEVVRLRRWSAVIIGFVGVLVILRPHSSDFSPAMLIALLSAALAAGSYISIKFLSRTEPPDAVVIYMTLIMTPLSLMPALLDWSWPSAMGWLWLAVIGFLGTAAQVCMTRAYQLGEVSALVPLNFLQLPVVVVLAGGLFGEKLDLTTACGAAAIIGANLYIARREVQLARKVTIDPQAVIAESAPRLSSARAGSRKLARDVVLDHADEFLCDVFATQGHRLDTVNEYWRGRRFAGARQRDADVRVFAFARTVDDAAHHREREIFDAIVLQAPFRHLIAHMALNGLRQFLKKHAGSAAATRTCRDQRRERA